jgi:hypothetical protein
MQIFKPRESFFTICLQSLFEITDILSMYAVCEDANVQ